MKAAESDPVAAARWKANMERAKALKAEAEREAEKEKEKLAAREVYVAGLLSDEQSRREAALAVANERFRALGKKLSRVSSARAEIKESAERIREECRLGIGTPSGLPEPVSSSEAAKRAAAKWLEAFVEEEAAPVVAEWDSRAKKLQVRALPRLTSCV